MKIKKIKLNVTSHYSNNSKRYIMHPIREQILH